MPIDLYRDRGEWKVDLYDSTSECDIPIGRGTTKAAALDLALRTLEMWIVGVRALARAHETPMRNDPEICICAAVKTAEGPIIRGHRHSDCLAAIGARQLTRATTERSQGFITSRNRFVDRHEGLVLQRAAGMESQTPGGYRFMLFSEDLY